MGVGAAGSLASDGLALLIFKMASALSSRMLELVTLLLGLMMTLLAGILVVACGKMTFDCDTPLLVVVV